MGNRPKCPLCGSRRWRNESSSGLLICSEGHVLQDYREEDNELGSRANHAIMKRALKRERRGKDLVAETDGRMYGPAAQFHYFRCLQFILRLQITHLIRAWNLPIQFEEICRDLWTFYLSISVSIPSPECVTKITEEMGLQIGDPISSQGFSDSDENDAGYGQSLDELLADLSDSDRSEDTTSSEEGENIPTRISRTSWNDQAGPVITLVVLLVACWTLRVPVLYQDLNGMVEAYQIPYLDVMARGILPVELVSLLNPAITRTISCKVSPSHMVIHTLAIRFTKRLWSDYQISVPVLNAAPLLWRMICSTQNPANRYIIAKKLAVQLHLDLVLHPTTGPHDNPLYEAPVRHGDGVNVETMLAVCILIAEKLESCSEDQGYKQGSRTNFHKYLLDEIDNTLDDMHVTLFGETLSGIAQVSDSTLSGSRWSRRGLETKDTAKIPIKGPNEGDGANYPVYASQDILGSLPKWLDSRLNTNIKVLGVTGEDVLRVLEMYERRLLKSIKRS